MTSNFQTSLPPHGVPMKISEIISAGADIDGKSVRIVGRVDHYDAHSCIALLSEPNKSTVSSPNLRVDTSLTDSSDFRLGSQVMLIGEMEKSEEEALEDGANGGHCILKARVSRCVDRLDYAIYCKTIDLWRAYDSSDG